MRRNQAVFLDRDGTLNHDCGYTHRLEDFRLLDNVVEGLRLLHQLGFELIVVTNQSGIARGYFGMDDLHRFNNHLAEILETHGIPLAGFYFSPYLPDASVATYRRASSCRKPGPGMLLQAARDHSIDLAHSYAVGDKRSDIAAGHSAGCRAILLRTGCAGSDDCPEGEPDWIADDLHAAAIIIEAQESAASQTSSSERRSSR
jgi:D-glycero-D-manno-heptose 1,7-bisphosphate phosphatase